jgi:serine/threonine-protein kinase
MLPAESLPARFEASHLVGGKYRLRKHLATGGMGEVWLALNGATGAHVALKLLRRGVADPERERETEMRFRNEARVSAGLAHRNIVKVFDLVESGDGTLGLVMEFLHGETLRAHLDRVGRLPEREAIAVATAVLNGLAHAHDRGIVHRDVTPANIFLAVDSDGHVTPKLVDFGIAKSTSSTKMHALQSVQTLDGRVLGTPMYMAPERIRGLDGIDPRSDVFASAVILYEMIAWECPFADSTPAASLAAVLERHVDPDPRIEPRLWLEIRRAMAKAPYERHATAREFCDALRKGLDGNQETLEVSLKVEPMTHWDDAAEAGAAVQVLASKSTHRGPMEQAPRRRRRWTVWAAAGALAGVALSFALLVARAMAAHSHATNGGAEIVPSPPAHEPPHAPAPLLAPALGPTLAPSSPAAPVLRNDTIQPGASSHAKRPASTEARPKPIATTPGF